MKSLIICTPHQILFGDKIEKNEINGACSTYGVRKGAYRVLVGKPVGKRPLGRFRRRLEDKFKTDREEVGLGHGLD
jgi:hypothetical protein